MASTPLITADDLVARLNPTTYMAIFDDTNTNDRTVVDASAAVTTVLACAHAKTVSWLGDSYIKIPDGTDSTIPELLRAAELDYAMALSFERHPEYVRGYGEQRRADHEARADKTMQRIQEATLRILDAPPEPKPRNVGGIVTDSGQRVFSDSANGQTNNGDF
jgi:hypothetical protein